MTPYLLLISHLFFTDGKVSKVVQEYQTVDLEISAQERAEGANNNWACAAYGEKLASLAGPNDAFIWQCVPAEAK